MKIKLGELKKMTENLCLMHEKILPVKISYAITRNIEALEKEFYAFEKQRIEICKHYAEKDEKGNPVTKTNPEDGKTVYSIPDDAITAFNDELNELSNEEVDIGIRKVDITEFEKCEQTDRYDFPTGNYFSMLGFMIEG